MYDLEVTATSFPSLENLPVPCTAKVACIADKEVIVRFFCHDCKQNGERSLEELKQGKSCSCKAKNMSHGELFIKGYLKSRGYSFAKEFELSSLGLSCNYRFDFFIPSLNLAIEFDGQQHFAPIELFGGSQAYENTVKRDREKDRLAEQLGIHLIRIPYNCSDIWAMLDTKLGTSSVSPQIAEKSDQ